MKGYKYLLLAFVCLTLSFLSLEFMPLNLLPNISRDHNPLLLLPERFRSFIAARLWEKADYLMHEGPIFSKQNFSAGSYAGNTDIIPLLKMIIQLCPSETAPYRLLASNYAYHLDMKEKAVSLLKSAVLNCKESPHIHEIYAALAFVHISANRNEKSYKAGLIEAGDLLDKAIRTFKVDEVLPAPAFKIENYYMLRARVFLDLGEPEKALSTWKKSGKSLEDSKDVIAKILLKYQQTGVMEDLAAFAKTSFPPLTPHSDCDFFHNQNFEAKDSCGLNRSNNSDGEQNIKNNRNWNMLNRHDLNFSDNHKLSGNRKNNHEHCCQEGCNKAHSQDPPQGHSLDSCHPPQHDFQPSLWLLFKAGLLSITALVFYFKLSKP